MAADAIATQRTSEREAAVRLAEACPEPASNPRAGVANSCASPPALRANPAANLLRLAHGGRFYVSVPEAAEALGVAPCTVRRAIQDGQLPHRRLRNRVLVPVGALQEEA